jgi:proteic killer suppression protein
MLQYCRVIRSFRHKGLSELYANESSRRVLQAHQPRILRLLHFLDASVHPWDMNIPGCYFHQLHGSVRRYSVRVSGNWRLTFDWEDSDATQVDLEDYH